MLRVGMTNPPFILDHLDAIAKWLNHPRVFSFLHVPVQSGDDDVLLRMNREYTAAEFRRVADFLLARVPNLNLATDVICGFPGETEEQFENTVKVGARRSARAQSAPLTVVIGSWCTSTAFPCSTSRSSTRGRARPPRA